VKRILIIANPTAGQGLAPAHRMAELLARYGAQADIAPTEYAGHAREIALQAALSHTADIVVAAGGDGTCGEVMTGLIGSPVPFAVLPAGTANVTALSLGLPRDADALARYILNGPVVPFRPALANGTPFLCVASVGFDAEAVHRVSLSLKRRMGKLAYAAAGLSAFAAPPPRFEAHANGRHFEVTQMIVSRVPFYAGRYRLFPNARPFANELNVLVVRQGGRARLLHFAVMAALGRHTGMRHVVRISCEQVHATAATPVAAQVDGDAFGTTPVTFSLSPEHVLLKHWA